MNAITFYSESLLQSFKKDGIVKTTLLDEAEIAALLSLYHETSQGISDRKFHSTMFVKDAEYRKTTNEGIRHIITDKINTVVGDYKMLFANFIVKETDADTRVGIHQDWNFTSPEFTSLNIWIPLVDIDESTGLFYALKGSQHTFHNLRYTPYEDDRYRELEPFILEESTPFSLKAGEALIYDGALVHFSDPNLSGMLRIAIAVVMIPAAAPNLHYYKRDKEKNKVEVYEVSEAFYNSFDFFDEPKGVRMINEIEQYAAMPVLDDLQKSIH